MLFCERSFTEYFPKHLLLLRVSTAGRRYCCVRCEVIELLLLHWVHALRQTPHADDDCCCCSCTYCTLSYPKSAKLVTQSRIVGKITTAAYAPLSWVGVSFTAGYIPLHEETYQSSGLTAHERRAPISISRNSREHRSQRRGG